MGLDVEHTLLDDQSLDDGYSSKCSRVRLISRDGSGARLDLRRLTYPGADEYEPQFLESWERRRRCAYRDAERRYNASLKVA